MPISKIFILCLLLASCGGGGDHDQKPPKPSPVLVKPDPMSPLSWEAQFSQMPTNMAFEPTGGWSFVFPRQPGHVNYVTMPYGSLEGKTRISMKFRIETDPDVKIVPTNFPDMNSILTLYFQRRGDNMSARGQYETYRWYATFRTVSPLSHGSYELSARLDENWTAVLTSSATTKPLEFQQAVRDADRVGFVLGGGDGYGHGVYATGPAKLVVTEFVVE